LDDLDGFGVVEGADFFYFAMLDGGFDAAEDAEAQFVFGAHGVDQVFLNFFSQAQWRPLRLFFSNVEEILIARSDAHACADAN
jgi:hypothetical protein